VLQAVEAVEAAELPELVAKAVLVVMVDEEKYTYGCSDEIFSHR
jgi:hypothetical protein